MNKKVFSLALCLLALGANAEVLTPAQALERVLDAAPSNGVRKIARMADAMEPAATMTLHVDPEVYLFTPAAGGLLLVSADSEAQPLLGYTDNFRPGDQIPPQLQFMMECWADEINAIRSGAVTYSNAPAQEFAPIAPICRTQWNQGAPYNNDCPNDNGGKTVTGCVATAMAQVLRVYEYPTKCSGGEFSYDWNGGNRTLSLNYDNIAFDWSKMKDTYKSNDDATEVAKLMYAVGVAAQMNFSSSASGTSGMKMAQGLARNFGYDNTLTYAQREWYTLDVWQKMIYDVLATGYPVYYDGANPDNSAGHAFVVDGYQSNGFFHLNWGWGGLSDGYFLLSALDPSAQGTGGSTAGYDRAQGAILGLKKGAETTAKNAPLVFFAQESFNCDVETATLGTSVKFQVGAGNAGVYSGTCITVPRFQLAIICEDIATGELKYLRSGSNVDNIEPFQGIWGYLNVSMTKSKFPVGKYTAKLAVYNTNSKEYYPVNFPLGVGSTVPFEVKDDGMIYFGKAETGIAECTTINVPEQIFAGIPFDFSADFVNNSKEPFYGPLVVKLYKQGSASALSTLGTFLVEVDPGQNVSAPCTLTIPNTVSEGNYYLKVLTESGTPLSNAHNIFVNEAPEISKPKASLLKVANKARNNLTFTMKVRVTSGIYVGPIYAAITNYGQNKVIASQPSETIVVTPEEAQNIEIHMNFASGEVGAKYTVYPFYKDGAYMRQADGTAVSFVLAADEESGILNVEIIESEGVEVFDVNGRRVAEPGKGLYIIRQGDRTTKVLK